MAHPSPRDQCACSVDDLYLTMLRTCWRLFKKATVKALTYGSSTSQSPLLTARLRAHLTKLLDQYHALQDKFNSPSSGDHQLLYQQMSSLEPTVRIARELEIKENEMRELKELCAGGEDGLKEMALQEMMTCHKEIQCIQDSLIQTLLPRDEADQHSAMLEVWAGAGGKEASLFTAEMFQMYQNFAAYKKWQFEILETDISINGGYKHASAGLNGVGVFGIMKHESGVHRVQRVPITEGGGRVHTSTMSVVLLPQPSEIDVEVNPSDLKVETHRSSGPGGQSVNTTDSAVRLTHKPTGIVVHIQDDRSQHKNRAKALKILKARLYDLKRKAAQTSQRQERKQQIGSGERHERIRTYNFLQDRVTDHRVNISIHGLEELMEGGYKLEELLEELETRKETIEINELLETI